MHFNDKVLHFVPALVLAGLLCLVNYLPGLFVNFISAVLLILLALVIGHRFIRAKDFLLQFILGLLLVISWVMVSGAFFLYFWKLSYVALQLITLTIPLIVLLPKKDSPTLVLAKSKSSAGKKILLFIFYLLFALSSAALVYLLVKSSTLNAIQSPWMVTPKIITIIYFCAALSLIIINLTSNSYRALVNSIFFFFSFSVVAIIYALGYGFDPFIHQATEKIIQASGTISPIPLYYLGHYALVVWLAAKSTLAITFIDVWLLPFLVSLFLPIIIYSAFRYNFNGDNLAIRLLPLIFLILPYDTLIQSTPQSLAFLLALIVIFLSLFYLSNQGITFGLILLISLAALAAHPLTGIPLLFFTLLLGLYRRFWQAHGIKKILRLTVYWSLTILAAISLPIIFLLQSTLAGKQATWTATEQDASLNLLLPYFHRFIRLEDLLYFFGYNFRWLIIILAIGGIIYIWSKKKMQFFLHYIITFLVLLTNYLLLKLFISFNFLIAYERMVFPQRILNLSFYFLLPLVLLTGYLLISKIRLLPLVIRLFGILFLALILSVSWYFSYPRFDYYQQDKGFSSSIYDRLAVNWINYDGNNKRYVVLANQSVAAMAVQQYGFKQYFNGCFYYPIPTGDPLYQSYLQLVQNSKPVPIILADVQALTGAERVYVVVNDYWFGFQDIVQRQKNSTTNWLELGQEKIYIFSYNLTADNN